jgi:protein-S-isoprenylcysteine O-methyltransferase Ste14
MNALELKIPPPIVSLIFGLLMWLTGQGTVALVFSFPLQAYVAMILIVGGLVIGAVGVLTFRQARTTLNPMKLDSTSLVSWGIYRFTRNPMYLGGLIVLLGWAIYLSNGLAFLFLPLYVLYMNRFQIAPEERALASLFGQDYADYRARVRRWL